MLDGKSWDESLRERLTGPLTLTRTVTLPEEAILYRAAVGHYASGVPVRVWGLPRSIGLGWRLSRWGGRTIIGHDGDTVGQSAYLRIDPEARLAVCLLTNAAESESLFRQLFNEVFGSLVGVEMPAVPRPAERVPRDSLAAGLRPPGPADIRPSDAADVRPSDPADLDLERHAGRYERTSRRFEVSVRDGQLHLVLTMTGNLAELTNSQPEELTLHPADSSGDRTGSMEHRAGWSRFGGASSRRQERA